MWLMKTVVKEKGLILMVGHEGFDLAEKIVGHGFVIPSGFLAAFHETDPWNSVDNRPLVPVMPSHLQHFRIGERGGFSWEIILVVYFYRIVRIQALHKAVFHIDSRHTVHGSRNQVGVVEAHGVA